MGGANHCNSYCHLAAKFRIMMHDGKCGAVIGYRNPTTWKLELSSYNNATFVANRSAVFPGVHQITKFRQMTV
jgi:hypothetical protein